MFLQAGCHSLGEPAGRRPRAKGEISPGWCRSDLHPWSSCSIPGDTGSLQGDVFAYFLQDQIVAAGSDSSSSDMWACSGLSPNTACSSACPAGSCTAPGKPQHSLFLVPVTGRRRSLLFDDKQDLRKKVEKVLCR